MEFKVQLKQNPTARPLKILSRVFGIWGICMCTCVYIELLCVAILSTNIFLPLYAYDGAKKPNI